MTCYRFACSGGGSKVSLDIKAGTDGRSCQSISHQAERNDAMDEKEEQENEDMGMLYEEGIHGKGTKEEGKGEEQPLMTTADAPSLDDVALGNCCSY